MRLRMLFWLSVWACLSVPAAHAEVQTYTRYQNYAIQGNSVEELRAAMDRNARAVGGHYATTKWNIQWSERWGARNGACGLLSYTVTLTVVFRMPEWRGAENADPALRDKWYKFRDALQRHEDGHKQMGVQAANQIEGILDNFGTVPDCSQMSAAVNRAGQTVLEQYQKKEIQYDAETQHGISQGAQF